MSLTIEQAQAAALAANPTANVRELQRLSQDLVSKSRLLDYTNAFDVAIADRQAEAKERKDSARQSELDRVLAQSRADHGNPDAARFDIFGAPRQAATTAQSASSAARPQSVQEAQLLADAIRQSGNG
jgi:hypothetical protein